MKYSFCFMQYAAQHTVIILTTRLIYSVIHIYSTEITLALVYDRLTIFFPAL